ncbi:MAG: type II secretion system F family protein [Candidatus Hydrogenedentota bacterium]
MPTFSYKVKDQSAAVVTGSLMAENQRAAIAKLRADGLFPIEVTEFDESAAAPSIRQTFQRIRLKDRNVFFRQLASLMQAGMPILRALATLTEQAENPKLKALMQDLHDAVHDGDSFADALARHPKVFPPMYTSLTRAGETGGMLDEVLWRMVSFGEKDEELRGKVIGAMVYPAFLLLISWITIFILVSFVFPKFVIIFDDFDASLPLITTIVIEVSAFMGKFWWAVLAFLGVVGMGIRSFLSTESGQFTKDGWLLKIPTVRGLIQRYEMAKFARTLGTLFDNGVPVLTALSITRETLSNRLIKRDLDEVHRRVSDGESISASLKTSPYFPPLVVNMLAVGEETGELGSTTQRVADTYELEVDRAVKAFTALLEPLIIVVMGIIVGFMVIAMLLPMLTLSAQVR